jgi:hypothetical protein
MYCQQIRFFLRRIAVLYCKIKSDYYCKDQMMAFTKMIIQSADFNPWK